ncbi:MAG TPA: hypothetical protein VJM31_10895 [Vicinamibacterales bacterium]|nr:hypothetical protein [Vicinamibacterales bacterium]
MRAIQRLILLTAIVLTPAVASAQGEANSSPFWDVAKSVALDPTTYAPATLSYTSMKLDWKTSQPLFQNGWVEQNHRFTVSGRPNDRPLKFGDGNKKIRNMALMHLQESVINNVAANVFERVLANKYPEHRKLFKTLSWIERIAFSSYVSYLASAGHFKQAQRNRELAMQYGYR